MCNYLLFFVFLSCFASSEEGWFSGTFSQVRSGLFSFFGYGESQDDFQQLHDMTRCKPGDVGEEEEPSRTQNRSVGQWLVDGLKSQKGKKIVCYVLVGGAVVAVTGGVSAAAGLLPYAVSGGGCAALLSATEAVAVPTVSELAAAAAVGGSAAVLSFVAVPQDMSPSEMPVHITPTCMNFDADICSTFEAERSTPRSTETETAMPSSLTDLLTPQCRPAADPVQYRAQNVTDGSQPACPSKEFWKDGCAELDGEPLYAVECSDTGSRIYRSPDKSMVCKCAQPRTGGFETKCSCHGKTTGSCEQTPLCASGCDAYHCVGKRTCYPPAIAKNNCGDSTFLGRLTQWFKNVVGVNVGRDVVMNCGH